MSLAIATASRDDNPNSTIGVESLIASAGWPVALAIQSRSHWRISATVMSTRGGATDFSGANWISGWLSSAVCESSCVSAMFRSPPDRPRARRPLVFCGWGSRQSVSSGNALATFPLRRLPSRYALRQARRPIFPLDVRGIAPAAVSSTSRTVTPWRTAIAARMSSATGARSILWAPAARSPTMTNCSDVSSGSRFRPACAFSNTSSGSSFAGTENAATKPVRSAFVDSCAEYSRSCG